MESFKSVESGLVIATKQFTVGKTLKEIRQLKSMAKRGVRDLDVSQEGAMGFADRVRREIKVGADCDAKSVRTHSSKVYDVSSSASTLDQTPPTTYEGASELCDEPSPCFAGQAKPKRLIPSRCAA